MLKRAAGFSNDAAIESPVNSGDVLGLGESIAAITTVGAGTWDAASIATGIIRRSGSVANYADTTDTAQAILTALAGNAPAAPVSPGTTFRLMVQNTVAFTNTLGLGRGVVAGVGTLNQAASAVREYLFTVINSTPEVAINCATTNANTAVTFNAAQPMGTVTPGMTVSGTGIAAGTTVVAVQQGTSGLTGVTLSANATATNNPVSLTFSPQIKIDGLASYSL